MMVQPRLAAESQPLCGGVALAAVAGTGSTSRGSKRPLGAPGAFDVVEFAHNVCKRFRHAREALRDDIIRGLATSAAAKASPALAAMAERSSGAPSLVPAATLANSGFGSSRRRGSSLPPWSAPVERDVLAALMPPQPRDPLWSAPPMPALDAMAPGALAIGMMQPLRPPRPVAPPPGEEILWDVSPSRRRASVGKLPLWTESHVKALGRSRSCPLSYLEYSHYLQRAMPGAELREAPEERIEDIEGVSGLELLRRLSAAATPPRIARRRPVPPLTDEERALAEQSLSDDGPLDEVLASRFSIDLTREKLQTLRPKIWLNDEVINFYFKLLQERSNKKATRCWCPNSFFWNKLSGGPDRDCSAYSFKEVKRWTFKAKVDLFELDHVVFPMNIGNCHWAMGAIDLKARGFRYFDSMMSPHPNFVPFLRRYVDDEHKAKKGGPMPDIESWDLLPPAKPVPQQQNGYDCGVFTCCFAEYFCAGRPLEFGQEDMRDLRLRLAARLVRADENWRDAM